MTSVPLDTSSKGSDIESAIATIRASLDSAISNSISEFLFAVGARDTRFAELASDAVSGGKRFRALCAYTGAAVCSGTGTTSSQLLESVTNLSGLDQLGAALECYQGTALVHDDVIDNSPTRRGRPSAHTSFRNQHSAAGLLGDADEYGVFSAVLLGDFLTSVSESVLAKAVSNLPEENSQHLLKAYANMTGEVAYGQFQDLTASYLPFDGGQSFENQIEATLAVVRVKSALYSVVRPTQLGSILAGAGSDMLESIEAILEPAGIAFQLRDDVLGAFGTEATTGKSNRTDIAERKRTVLLSIAIKNCDAQTRNRLAEIYQSETVSDGDVEEAAQILRDFAQEEHEKLITELVSRSHQQLQRADLTSSAKELLLYIVGLLTERTS